NFFGFGLLISRRHRSRSVSNLYPLPAFLMPLIRLLTNAYTESVNNLIKGIKKAGRGYKFDTLRERCLLEINSPKPKKFDLRMAEYIPIEEAGQNKRASLYNHFQRTAEYNQFPLQHIMTVYLDVNSSKNRVHTTLERIQAYCDLIQTIHH
ncbi:MAG: transposase, partial [Eubacterium sp.]|nr:transposase [Eubacterium sp.]